MDRYIINPTGTGRKIKVGGPTYNKLKNQGYFKNGSGKKVSGKKVSGKKPVGKKAPSMTQIKENCSKATKTEVINALNTLSKAELCRLLDHIPKASKPVSASMKKKLAAHLAKINDDRNPNPNACNKQDILKCQGVYCSKSGKWACPSELVGGDFYFQDRYYGG